MANEKQAKGKNSKGQWIGAIVLLLVIVVGGLAALQAIAADTGESCADGNGCKWGNVCISKRCYKKCDTNSDCPADMHCGATDVNVTTTQVFHSDESKGTEHICFANKTKAAAGAGR